MKNAIAKGAQRARPEECVYGARCHLDHTIKKAPHEAASSQFGTKSLSAYVRKMAFDGPIIDLQIPELSEVISQMRENAETLNQIAARVNSTGRIYPSDLAQIAQD